MTDKYILNCNCSTDAADRKPFVKSENELRWNENETCNCPRCGGELSFNWNVGKASFVVGYCFYKGDSQCQH